jgi:hypothetical protein
MIFVASWAVSARLYALFQALAPSNIIIRRIHARIALKWGTVISTV